MAGTSVPPRYPLCETLLTSYVWGLITLYILFSTTMIKIILATT